MRCHHEMRTCPHITIYRSTTQPTEGRERESEYVNMPRQLEPPFQLCQLSEQVRESKRKRVRKNITGKTKEQITPHQCAPTALTPASNARDRLSPHSLFVTINIHLSLHSLPFPLSLTRSITRSIIHNDQSSSPFPGKSLSQQHNTKHTPQSQAKQTKTYL